jgi:hypothetical protein
MSLRLSIRESISEYYLAYLFHLIRFCLPATRLQVDNLADIVSCENMVISTHALGESKLSQQTAKVMEIDVIIGCASEDSLKCFFVPAH